MKLARMMSIKALFVLGLLPLTSCSLLSPVKLEAKNTYVLNKVPTNVIKKKTHPITLLVLPPETRPVYNTTAMAYTIKSYQVAYFSQNQWAETPSQMLQPLITQTLQNTHYFHAIVTPPYMGRYDYILSTDISQLQQDFTHRPALLQFTIRAQIVRASTNQVVASKQFVVHEPIRFKSPYSGVVSANRATEKILRELATFCVEKIHG